MWKKINRRKHVIHKIKLVSFLKPPLFSFACFILFAIPVTCLWFSAWITSSFSHIVLTLSYLLLTFPTSFSHIQCSLSPVYCQHSQLFPHPLFCPFHQIYSTFQNHLIIISGEIHCQFYIGLYCPTSVTIWPPA